jgi:hypothetical protein
VPARRRYTPIPRGARERVVERDARGVKLRSEYMRRGEVVAVMLWETNGEPCWGWGLKGGKKHGLSVEWDDACVVFVEPYENGVAHGVAKHFDTDGKLLLETRYVRGTGVDLWCDLFNRTLAEETWLEGGSVTDVRRWNPDQRTVWLEERYRDGQEHGIFRQWNDRGRLRRGFPRYFVQGKRVDKRTYARRAEKDPTLPRCEPRDDDPRRRLPAAYVGQPLHRERRRGS